MFLIKELWRFLRVRKKFWLAPPLVVLVILSGFIALAASSGVLSTTLYMLF